MENYKTYIKIWEMEIVGRHPQYCVTYPEFWQLAINNAPFKKITESFETKEQLDSRLQELEKDFTWTYNLYFGNKETTISPIEKSPFPRRTNLDNLSKKELKSFATWIADAYDD